MSYNKFDEILLNYMLRYNSMNKKNQFYNKKANFQTKTWLSKSLLSW